MSALQEYKRRAKELEKEVADLRDQNTKLRTSLCDAEDQVKALALVMIAPIGDKHLAAMRRLKVRFPELYSFTHEPSNETVAVLTRNL